MGHTTWSRGQQVGNSRTVVGRKGERFAEQRCQFLWLPLIELSDRVRSGFMALGSKPAPDRQSKEEAPGEIRVNYSWFQRRLKEVKRSEVIFTKETISPQHPCQFCYKVSKHLKMRVYFSPVYWGESGGLEKHNDEINNRRLKFLLIFHYTCF